MKLAEALVQMKDMKGKMAQLIRKIQFDQLFERVDESQVIPNNVDDFIDDYVTLSETLVDMKTRVATTNVENGLTVKIHRMESLRSLISQLESLTCNKQERLDLKHISYDKPPVPVSTFATYNVENLTLMLDNLRDEIRSLDLELQRLNWEVELVD